MPKVSVIMPTYNAAHFLPRAIESVCAQTLTDWELIVVDDGSTDGTVEVIRDYLTDPRIRFLQNPQNMGPSHARNRALDVATGQWIALLDADDWYEPQRLEKMVGTAEAFKVGIVYDLLRWVDAATGEERRIFFSSRCAPPSSPIRVSVEEAFRWHLVLQPLMCHELIARHQIRYDPFIRVGEDYLFQMQVFLKCGEGAVVPEALYNYRLHRGSTYIQNFFNLDYPKRVYTQLLSLPEVCGERRLRRIILEDYRRVMLAHAYPQFTMAIKQRNWRTAWMIMRRAPFVVPHLIRQLPQAVRRRLRGESTTYDWEAFR
jgi:succinoglycan biosynthesis protein ExoO